MMLMIKRKQPIYSPILRLIQLCVGKQSGSDNIPQKVLKSCNFDDIIWKYANKLLVENVKPNQWSEIDLIPHPKSGDLINTSNYRGISLLSVVAKFINKLNTKPHSIQNGQTFKT